jgi:hypothetical protein
MFRNSIRSFGEPVGIFPVAFEVSDTPRQNSIRRPTLCRIKRGLFSNKSPLERNNQQTEPNYTISNLSYNGENQQWLNDMELATTRREERVTSTNIQLRSLDANTSRAHTNGWKDLNQSGGFKLIKRSLSKSKQRVFGSDTASLVGDQRGPIERESGPEQIRPTSAICIPGDVPSDFSNMTARRTPQQRERELTGSAANFSKPSHLRQTPPRDREQRRPVAAGAAYVPKHAASDFSKMKQFPKSDYDHPLQPGDSVTIRPAAYEPSDESTDYQNFIASARITTARTYNSHGIWSPNVATSKASRVMDDIIANHNLDVRLQRTTSASKRSSTARPVSSASVFGKVGHYLKPPRPESGTTDETTANHNNSLQLQRTISVSRRSTVPRRVSSGGVFEKFGNYIKPTRPESAEITTKHNTKERLQRANSVPRRSTVSRPMSSGGIFEKVGDYIKPTRPLSGISDTTTMEDDKSSFRGNIFPQDRLGNRWSRVSGSIRQSILMNSYAEVDEEAGQSFWKADESKKQGDSWAPTSPVLKNHGTLILFVLVAIRPCHTLLNKILC